MAGLKQQLGLKDAKAPSAGSTQQAAQFKAAFQAGMKPVTDCLQYTAANAEKSKHAALASKKGTAVASYQNALAMIDPNDENKAQAAINNVLASVNGLSAEATKLKQDTEKALKAWQKKEPSHAEAAGQVEELEDWEDKEAAQLRSGTDDVQTKADQKKYDEAGEALDKLQTKVKPRYEEYKKQSEAKKEFDKKQMPDIQAAPSGGAGATGEDAEKQKKIDAAKARVDSSVSEKDYVDANKGMDDLTELTQDAGQDFTPELEQPASLQLKLNEEKKLTVKVSNAASAPANTTYAWTASGDGFEVSCGDTGATANVSIRAKKVGSGSVKVQVAVGSKSASTSVSINVAEAQVAWSSEPAAGEIDIDQEFVVTAKISNVVEPDKAPITAGLTYGGSARCEQSNFAWKGDTITWKHTATNPNREPSELTVSAEAQIPGQGNISQEFVYQVKGFDIEAWAEDRKKTLEKIKEQLSSSKTKIMDEQAAVLDLLNGLSDSYTTFKESFEAAKTKFNAGMKAAANKAAATDKALDVLVSATLGVMTGGFAEFARAAKDVHGKVKTASEIIKPGSDSPFKESTASAADYEAFVEVCLQNSNSFFEVVKTLDECNKELDKRIEWLGKVTADTDPADPNCEEIDKMVAAEGKVVASDVQLKNKLSDMKTAADSLAKKTSPQIEQDMAIQWLAQIPVGKELAIATAGDYLISIGVIDKDGNRLDVDTGGEVDLDELNLVKLNAQVEAEINALVGQTMTWRGNGRVRTSSNMVYKASGSGSLHEGAAVICTGHSDPPGIDKMQKALEKGAKAVNYKAARRAQYVLFVTLSKDQTADRPPATGPHVGK